MPILEHDPAADLAVYASRLVRIIRSLPNHPAGARVLSILDERGPLSITALARLDACSQPTMSAQVAHLADRGFLSKEPNPDDARGSVITLTNAGRAYLESIRAAAARAIRERSDAAGRTDSEIADAVALLRDLVETDPQNSERIV